MTSFYKRPVAALAALALTGLVILACNSQNKAEEAQVDETVVQAGDAEVVMAAVKQGETGEAKPRGSRFPVGPGGEFASSYHPDAASHIASMESSLKPLEAIPAQGK